MPDPDGAAYKKFMQYATSIESRAAMGKAELPDALTSSLHQLDSDHNDITWGNATLLELQRGYTTRQHIPFNAFVEVIKAVAKSVNEGGRAVCKIEDLKTANKSRNWPKAIEEMECWGAVVRNRQGDSLAITHQGVEFLLDQVQEIHQYTAKKLKEPRPELTLDQFHFIDRESPDKPSQYDEWGIKGKSFGEIDARKQGKKLPIKIIDPDSKEYQEFLKYLDKGGAAREEVNFRNSIMYDARKPGKAGLHKSMTDDTSVSLINVVTLIVEGLRTGKSKEAVTDLDAFMEYQGDIKRHLTHTQAAGRLLSKAAAESELKTLEETGLIVHDKKSNKIALTDVAVRYLCAKIIEVDTQFGRVDAPFEEKTKYTPSQFRSVDPAVLAGDGKDSRVSGR